MTISLKSINQDTGKIVIEITSPIRIELDFTEANLLRQRIMNGSKNPFRGLKKYELLDSSIFISKEDIEHLKELLSKIPKVK